MIFLTIIPALIWGWISRMCGGGKPSLPWGLQQWLYAIPHGALGYVALGWYGIPLAYVFAFIGKRAGHGQWFDMGTSQPHTPQSGKKPEKLDFIVRWIMGEERLSYHRDYVGMVVSGVFITLGSIICLILANAPLLATLVFCGGALKAQAYVYGTFLAKKFGGEYNPYGEFLTGFFDTLAVGLCIYFLMS